MPDQPTTAESESAKAGPRTVNLPVLIAPARATLFPANIIVIDAPDDTVELVLLRPETLVVTQAAEVLSEDGNETTMQLGAPMLRGVISDIGRVRLKRDDMPNTAFAILSHLVSTHKVERDDLLNRLRDALDRAT